MEKIINDYIGQSDWRVKENANTAFSLSGLKSFVASSALAKDSLSKLTPKIREAHKSGKIHIHDLDGSLYAPYCVSGGTNIQTPNGTLAAKEVKVGDVLVGYNEELKRFEHTTVEKIFCREVDQVYKLKIKRSDNFSVNLQITGNHKVLTNTGWKAIEDINIGEEILYLPQSRRNKAKKNREARTKEERSEIYRIASSPLAKEKASEIFNKYWENKDKIIEERKSSGFYKRVSERMKINNPMFKKDVVKRSRSKALKTIAENKSISNPQRQLFEIVKSIYQDTEIEYPIKTNNCMRFIDVAIPSLKIALEFDGTYWHNLPGRKESDIVRDNELKEIGWTIYHFNENSNLDTEIVKLLTPENGATVISKKLLVAKSVGKRNYKYKVYNFHCTPHENYLANSMIVHNCFGADLQQLMLEGLKNPVGSNSTPAKHFDTMIDHMVNYIYISQAEFNGAQAFSNVDTLLAPFVVGMTHKEVKQQMQRLIYNISYPLRSAFQTPFFNTSFDLIPPEHMKNEPVVLGGRLDESMVYGDLQKEMDIINSTFLELMIDGDSQGKPFTFPIPTYGMTRDVLNKNDNTTRLLYTLAAKFGSPNFQNYIGSGNDPSDVRSMCCRLSLDIKKLKSRGLWNMGNKTGSLGVCTINLNHASKDGESKFLENIDIAYDLSIEEILIKHKYIMEAFNKGLLPFTKQYLNNKDPFKSFFHTIGVAGMNEACINMFNSSIEENQDFTIEILKHIRARTDETTEETSFLHNLEETPIEGATYRLAKLDRASGLPTQGDLEPYLTNSTHCPVDTELNWIQNIRIQEKFKSYYSGGTILHGFIGEQISPICAEKLIKTMSLETKIPYYNLTPTFSMCKNHGYVSGEIKVCPICKEENLVYSRVVGYLQPVQKWNKGKKEEFKDRKMYKV